MLMAYQITLPSSHSQHHYWKFCSASAFKDMFIEAKLWWNRVLLFEDLYINSKFFCISSISKMFNQQ